MNYRMGWFARVIVTLVALFLIAPIVVIVALAFTDANNLSFPPEAYSTRWISEFFNDRAWTRAFRTSLRLGAWVTFLALLIGVPLGLGISRGVLAKRSRAPMALIAAPQIMPAVSLSIGFYFVAAQMGFLNSQWPLIIAQTTLSLPLVVLAVMTADSTLDRRLEDASRTLGATPARTLVTITFPLLLPGIIAGAVFSFLTSWDDVTNAVFLGTPRMLPLPLKMWNTLHYELSPIIAAASIVTTSISLLIFVIAGTAFMIQRRVQARSITQPASSK
jgi:putative spermidine/putrescine transport system permease protein